MSYLRSRCVIIASSGFSLFRNDDESSEDDDEDEDGEEEYENMDESTDQDDDSEDESPINAVSSTHKQPVCVRYVTRNRSFQEQPR